MSIRSFGCGCLLGLLGGVALVLCGSILLAARIKPLAQTVTGTPDVSVVVAESYLNREAARRIKGSYPTGVNGLTLTDLQLDLGADNRLDMVATFHLVAGFVEFDTNARVNNQVSVQGGRLVVNMVGDPQLGNLDLPFGALDALPFNLKESIKNAVDSVNNGILLTELNQAVQSGLGSEDFYVDGVSTTSDALTIKLRHR